MTVSTNSIQPWWNRRTTSKMRLLLEILDEAVNPVERDFVRSRVHGSTIIQADRRGLVEISGSVLTLTERGQLIARDQVSGIPVEHCMACDCGLVVDDRDAAQVDYLRQHQAGSMKTQICPIIKDQ